MYQIQKAQNNEVMRATKTLSQKLETTLQNYPITISKVNTLRLKAYLDVKVREYSESELSALGVMFGLLARQIGVKESPSKQDLIHLTGFVKRNYSDFSSQEIRLAFDMAMSGQLGIDENKTEHYQSFNSKYVGFILSKYRKFRNEAIKELESEQRKMEEEEKQIRKNSPEYRESMYNGLMNWIDTKNEVPETWDFYAVYKHMNANKMIDDSVDELRDFMSRTKNELQSKINTFKASGDLFQLNLFLPVIKEDHLFKQYWRKEWARNYANQILISKNI